MQLNELKQAAKRLRTLSPEHGGSATTLTHAQALDVVAQLHGFRHYHEARQRLGDEGETPAPPASLAAGVMTLAMQKAMEVMAEAGGLIPVTGDIADLAAVSWPENGTMAICGPSGSGKTILAREIVCKALASGTPVRVLDTEGSYRHFAYAMGGQHYYDMLDQEAISAWNSDAPLVVISLSTSLAGFSYEALKGLPKHALFVCEDTAHQGLRYEPLGVRTLRILTTYDIAQASEVQADVVFTHKQGSRTIWQLRAPGTNTVELRHALSCLRNDRYFGRL